MQLYQPTITGSLSISGSIVLEGPITVISGSVSGTASLAETSSYSQNSERLDNLDSTSFVFTSSYNVDSSSFSGRVTTIESKYATTGSNIFTSNQTICGNLTTTGTITAQTINVQQVTSSIVYSCGSNIFGCAITDTQQFTGSMFITGSNFRANVNNACFQGSVCATQLRVSSTGDLSYVYNSGASTTDANFYIYNSTKDILIVRNSGCIGIGTANPTKALEIVSNTSQDGIKISGTSNPRLTIVDTTNSVQFDALTTDTEVVLRSDTNHPLHLSTNGTLRLNITNTGLAIFCCSVGIGTSPSYKLHIIESTANGRAIQAVATATSGTNYGAVFAAEGSGATKNIGLYASAEGATTNVAAHFDKGNVGIGTSNPTGKLMVEATGNHLFLRASTATAGKYWNFDVTSANQLYIVNNAGTQYLTITDGGNVGIGTSSPSVPLDIQSNSSASALRIRGRSADDIAEVDFYNYANNSLLARIQVDNDYLGFTVGATERMRITSGGDLQFGNTSTNGQFIYGGSNAGYIYINGGAGTSLSCGGRITLVSADRGGTNLRGEVALEAGGTSAGSFITLNTCGSERMRITSGGNVGIGVTPFNNTLSKSLDLVNGGGMFAASNNFYVVGNANYDNQWLYKATSGAAMINLNAGGDGTIAFINAASGTAGTYISTFSEKMRITSGGQMYNSNPPANNFAQLIFGNGTTNQSLGLKIIAGSSSSDTAFVVKDKDDSGTRFCIRGDGYIYAPPVYNNTSANAANVVVTSGGDLIRSTSSCKYKKDIIDYDKGLSIVNQLRPVYYKGKSEVDGDKQFAGLIAEEVHDLGLTEFVQYAEDGTPDAISYQNMAALFAKAIQEQQCTINTLKSCLGIS